MILYHGSTEIVEEPKIIAGNKFLDFGFGFYTTTSKEQAVRWAEIKKKRIKATNAYLNIYEIDNSVFANGLLSIHNFEKPTQNWLEFVVANRQGNTTHNYDIISGPVANDTLYRTITMYEAGVLTWQETINRLKVHELYDQISFHSTKALKYLKYKETIEIK